MATAILVDGAFFLRRFSSCFPDHDANDPKSVTHGLELLVYWHLAQRIGAVKLLQEIDDYNIQLLETAELYRIFFYDCGPLIKRMHTPLKKHP